MATVATPVTAAGTAAPDRALARRLVWCAIAATVIAAFIYLLMVRTALGQRFDNAALLGSRQQQFAARVGDATSLQRITADSFAVVLVVIVGLGVIRRRWRLGVAAAAAALLAVGGVDLLKNVILTRPQLVSSDAASIPSNSYPSGHTATALACALALVVITPTAMRGVAAVVAGSYGWITAAQVQTAGWHRPSDAIGAAFLAFAAVAVVLAVLAVRRPVGDGPRLFHIPAFVILGGVWLYAAAISALNAVRVLHFLADNAEPTAPTAAVLNESYQFSVNLTIVVVVTLVATLLLVLDRADLDAPGAISSR